MDLVKSTTLRASRPHVPAPELSLAPPPMITPILTPQKRRHLSMQNASKLTPLNSSTTDTSRGGGGGGEGVAEKESLPTKAAPADDWTKRIPSHFSGDAVPNPFLEKTYYPPGDDISAKNRMRALKELIDSETLYFTQLKTLVYYFIEPLQKEGSWGVETFKVINVSGALQQLCIICDLTKKILYVLHFPFDSFFLSDSSSLPVFFLFSLSLLGVGRN